MHHINSYSPLKPGLTVGKSKLHGLGIIATKDIEQGTDLGVCNIEAADYEDGFIRTPLGGFINHSDNPNCSDKVEGKNYRLLTTRLVRKGEEITVSYRGWYDDAVLDSFN